MNILYCDCFSGISGDMFLAAMIDAGLPVDLLHEQFTHLGLPEYHGVSTERIKQGAIAATTLRLDFEEPDSSIHEHEHEHNHEAGQEHPSHGHHHANQRSWLQIRDLIEASTLSPAVKARSIQIFLLLAQAEARVHGVPVDKVHFHEVGAVDSILDIVGAAVGLDFFNIEAVYSSPLPMSSGHVMTQHGLLPLPAPATLELMRMANARLIPSSSTKELVTPTGAAILASGAIFSQPEFELQKIGIGAGKHILEWPNILRLMIGTRDQPDHAQIEIETNIDDMNPQVFGSVMSNLFAAGALDVFFTSIYMKKNRPATKVSVIARREDEDKLCDLLLYETTTLGVRVRSIWRHEAQREIRTIQTQWGSIPVKVKILNHHPVQAAPEYDVCVRLAETSGVPVALILEEAAQISRQLRMEESEKTSR
jgi:uncharacterized protein (TIGR00299 family) protein